MKNFTGAILSRLLVVVGASLFVLKGNEVALVCGCLCAFIVEIIVFFQQPKLRLTRSVVVVLSLLELALVASVTVIYFQSNMAFWTVLVTWVLACWLLPKWRRKGAGVDS